MKIFFKRVLFGFLLWLTVFISAFPIFPLKQSNAPFFETLIGIFLSGFTVMYGYLYFKKETVSAAMAIKTGFSWMLLNILIDLPLFTYGPVKKTFADYMTDIGLTYLMIPIILIGFSFNGNNIKQKTDENQ